jgi:hypothetical protein
MSVNILKSRMTSLSGMLELHKFLGRLIINTMEINPIYKRIEDMRERAGSLRGYL